VPILGLKRWLVWVEPAVFLGSNPFSLVGAVLTTSAAITMLGFWALELLLDRPLHPYAGILLFLVLPGVFALGLILMPLGLLWRRRRLRARGILPSAYPSINLRDGRIRRGVSMVAGATVLNVAIMSVASYHGVEYMDSPQFCGMTCHSVMAPEHTAYLESPHSRVACVQCHIGPGAPWFVRSKLAGARQVWAVAFKTYSRPIPSPVKHLRPARETCEQCHWPQKFHGDKFVVHTKYSDDEKNTPLTTVLVVKIGGRTWNGAYGIHGRHLDTQERISYFATDNRRQVIPRVSYIDDSGSRVEYSSDEVKVTADQIAQGEHRKMDCMDCHNRPSHVFELPERAVDRALSDGRISPQLPYIKKKSVELLKTDYPDRQSATKLITSKLTEYYQTTYPEVYRKSRTLVEVAAGQVGAIYAHNVFPEMKVGWGTYPNNLGHDDFLGCFRCHDENHKTSDGRRSITQDCNACHTILAQEESNPKVLSDLGLK